MLRVQILAHNIITGTLETCTIAGPNAAECGAGQHLMGECRCGRGETRVCGMQENKRVLTLGNLIRAQVRLTPKARFVWLVWLLCAALGRGSFSHPWLGWKRRAPEHSSRVTPPQNENYVINHLPPCRSKPVKALFVFGTQFKIFWMKTGRLVTVPLTAK